MDKIQSMASVEALPVLDHAIQSNLPSTTGTEKGRSPTDVMTWIRLHVVREGFGTVVNVESTVMLSGAPATATNQHLSSSNSAPSGPPVVLAKRREPLEGESDVKTNHVV
jgi:hypothetical protein